MGDVPGKSVALPDDVDQWFGEIETAIKSRVPFTSIPRRSIAREGVFVSIDKEGSLLVERGYSSRRMFRTVRRCRRWLRAPFRSLALSTLRSTMTVCFRRPRHSPSKRKTTALDNVRLPHRRVFLPQARVGAEFTETHNLDARNALAVKGFSDIAMARKKPDDAIKSLIEAAELDPENPRYYDKAGKIELDRGNKDQGVSLLRLSLELDPGYIVAFAYLASMYIGDGNYEEAEKVFRDAADYSPTNAEAQAQDANLLALLHKWDAAAQRYDRAKTIEPGNASYLAGICSLPEVARQAERGVGSA